MNMKKYFELAQKYPQRLKRAEVVVCRCMTGIASDHQQLCAVTSEMQGVREKRLEFHFYYYKRTDPRLITVAKQNPKYYTIVPYPIPVELDPDHVGYEIVCGTLADNEFIWPLPDKVFRHEFSKMLAKRIPARSILKALKKLDKALPKQKWMKKSPCFTWCLDPSLSTN